jgi:invasion protein IalB
MIQTPIRYNVPQPQVTENPVNLKDDFNKSKNQMKVSVQILSKENEKQATLPLPLDVAVQKGTFCFIFKSF